MLGKILGIAGLFFLLFIVNMLNSAQIMKPGPLLLAIF